MPTKSFSTFPKSVFFCLQLGAGRVKNAQQALHGFVKVEDNSTLQTIAVNYSSSVPFQMASLQVFVKTTGEVSLEQRALCLTSDSLVKGVQPHGAYNLCLDPWKQFCDILRQSPRLKREDFNLHVSHQGKVMVCIQFAVRLLVPDRLHLGNKIHLLKLSCFSLRFLALIEVYTLSKALQHFQGAFIFVGVMSGCDLISNTEWRHSKSSQVLLREGNYSSMPRISKICSWGGGNLSLHFYQLPPSPFFLSPNLFFSGTFNFSWCPSPLTFFMHNSFDDEGMSWHHWQVRNFWWK